MEAYISLLLLVLVTFSIIAQEVIKAGTGLQNTGATRELTWRQALQGLRKGVPAFTGWRLIGDKRVYTPCPCNLNEHLEHWRRY